jgi:K+-sensing histidine kinase KdpD
LLRHYVIAFFLVAATLALTLPLQHFFPYPFLFLFFAAVMTSAWFGGMAAGLFAVLISTLAVDYFFVPPLHSFAINATDTAYFAAFIFCAVVASLVSSSKRKTEEELKGTRDQLEVRVAERTAELQRMISELRENECERTRLEGEKSALAGKLETRKLVERAKGILQRELKISEQDAYRSMQQDSQQRRKSMRDISELIILNDDLKRSSR